MIEFSIKWALVGFVLFLVTDLVCRRVYGGWRAYVAQRPNPETYKMHPYTLAGWLFVTHLIIWPLYAFLILKVLTAPSKEE